MFLGVEYHNSYTFIVSVMDKTSKVINISPYTLEGLLHLIDHSDIRVIAFNSGFNMGYSSSLSNRTIKSLNKNLQEYFDFRPVENLQKKNFRTILYTDSEEFFKRVIRKEILPENSVEGIEQRLYNIPKTGIKLNRSYISKDRNIAIRQINAVILSYTAYSYHNNSFDFIEEDEIIYIIPKYRYIPIKNRERNQTD